MIRYMPNQHTQLDDVFRALGDPTRRAVLARLSTEMRQAVTAPDVRSKLESQDLIIIADTPEQFAALQKQGIEQFGEIIKAAGIEPQ